MISNPKGSHKGIGALGFGTVVLLLNIYIIIHGDIFKLVILNVKHSKYIQVLQFSNISGLIFNIYI